MFKKYAKPLTNISIHAPHAGSDCLPRYKGSDVPHLVGLDGQLISIHAPHAGSDAHAKIYQSRDVDFNPRSPCGERRSTPC